MNEQIFDDIERYLRGKMAAAERAGFERAMSADPALTEQVAQQRFERLALEVLVEDDLLAKMRGWEQETAVLTATVRRPSFWRSNRVVWSAAASIALLLTGWWAWNEFSTPTGGAPMAQETKTPKKTTPTKPGTRSDAPVANRSGKSTPSDERYVPYDPGAPERPTVAATERPTAPQTSTTPTTAEPTTVDYDAMATVYYRDNDFMGPGSGSATAKGGDASYQRALRAFQEGRYGESVTTLRPAVPQTSADWKTRELFGHSLYKEGRLDEAYVAFREVSASGAAPYAQRADWAMVLTLLRQMPNRSALFSRALSKITDDPGHPYHTRAKQLAKDIGQ